MKKIHLIKFSISHDNVINKPEGNLFDKAHLQTKVSLYVASNNVFNGEMVLDFCLRLKQD